MNAPVPASRGDPAAVAPESDLLAIRLVPRGEAVEVTWEADVHWLYKRALLDAMAPVIQDASGSEKRSLPCSAR